MRIVWLLLLFCFIPIARADDFQLTPRQALRAKISEVKWEQLPAEQAIDWLRDVLGTNIVVDWTALETVGVDRTSPVSVNLRWVQVNRLMRILFQDAGGRNFAFYTEGNVLHITTREAADEPILTRSYPVEDLLLKPRKIERIKITISTSSDGGTESTIFNDDSSDSDDQKEIRKDAEESLIQSIMDLFPTETWRDNGGRSKLTIFRGQLIVSAPRSVQEAIGGTGE